MPLHEFWYDDPDLLWAYRNVYIEKEKRRVEEQQEMINFQSWLQGYYNHIAIVSSLSKNIKYLSKPIDLSVKTEKDKKIEVAQKIKENMKRGKAILEHQRGE